MRISKSCGIIATVSAALALAGAPAQAAPPYVSIASAGPLSEIHLGNELSCQVAHIEDPFLEFYPSATVPGDCGTFVEVAGNLYAPDFGSHDGTATYALGAYTSWTPVSQSAVSGSGTAVDPFEVTTVVSDSGSLTVTETDSYVTGSDAYRTDVEILNGGGAPIEPIVYRAGDCYLGGSDYGYGYTQAAGAGTAIGCSGNANNVPAGRIEQWVPLTPGSTYYQDFYGSVWAQIGSGAPFPDTCMCNDHIDNGGGLSWVLHIPAGASATVSHLTRFSGALATTLTANPAIASVLPGNQVYLEMSAHLAVTDGGAPVVGRNIDFVVGGTLVCSAQTDASGNASCGSLLTLVSVVRSLGYEAEFGGDYDYKSSQDTGPLLSLNGTELP